MQPDIPNIKNPEPMIVHPDSLVTHEVTGRSAIRIDTLYNIAKREGWEDAYIGIKTYIPCRNAGQFVETSDTIQIPHNDHTRVEKFNDRKWFMIEVMPEDDDKNPLIECGCNACCNCPYHDCEWYFDEDEEDEEPIEEYKTNCYRKKSDK